MNGLEPRVRSIVAVHLDVDPERLRPEARLGEDLCVDSLAAVELAMVLEDEFDITLPEEVLGCVATFGDVVGLVEDRVEMRAQVADSSA
jgi:acyl carrier protein